MRRRFIARLRRRLVSLYELWRINLGSLEGSRFILLVICTAMLTASEHASAGPISPECETSQCMEEIVIVGYALYPVGGGTWSGGGGGEVLYMDQVSQETYELTLIRVGEAMDLQCISSVPSWSNKTLAQIHALGRTTSHSTDEQKQDLASFLVAWHQARGTLGSVTFRGRTVTGLDISILAVRFADGGSQLYEARALSTIKAEPIQPGQLAGNPTVRVDGDGVAREATCPG